MAALVAYLRQMTPPTVPGIDGSTIHFATIVTPDADPAQRQGMLDVLTSYVQAENVHALAQGPRMESPHMGMLRDNHRWILHTWQLVGPPTSWGDQLRTRLAREPVFAVLSGLGGANWAPIHEFCETAALPCLFPNVDWPVDAERDFYPVYFSKNVLLEAALLSHRLRGTPGLTPKARIVQVYRTGDVGEQAAKALAMAIGRQQIVNRPIGSGGSAHAVAALLEDVGEHDILVLWLRPRDLARITNTPIRTRNVLISGIMGGLNDAPVSAAWRPVALMSYPFALPEQRGSRMDYPLGWMRINRIPLVDERVQTDTWLACNLLSEALDHMGGELVRDLLVEHIERALEHQLITGYYPRLSLAPNQRFASKGGYLVRFADGSGSRIRAESDWLVP
jgi:hypothetical protein